MDTTPMRLLVLALALLAGTKVWTQDTLFRAGAEQALVAAYRERATKACEAEPPLREGTALRHVDWSRPETIRMTTGSRNIGVYFWQVDDALWNARYRNPYLVLTARGVGTPSTCEYDTIYGTALVTRG
ncbi:MAG: hypothetical protein ACT4N2_07570 [Hyphomicrobium sp.]